MDSTSVEKKKPFTRFGEFELLKAIAIIFITMLEEENKMRKLIATLLAAIMLLACIPAMAEENVPDPGYFSEEMGLNLDFSAITDKCENLVSIELEGVMGHDPYLAIASVYYYLLPRESVMEIVDLYYQTDDEEERDAITQIYNALMGRIGYILVTDDPDQESVVKGIDIQSADGLLSEEFATLDNWHYYYIGGIPDELLAVYDAPEAEGMEEAAEKKGKDVAEIERLHAALIEALKAREVKAPVDPSGVLIGQTLSFVTTDLDGNEVRSEDLFKDNSITMVNFWGTWCPACVNEMAELAQLHTRLREKGCGIVGLEYEKKPMEEVREAAEAILANNGVAYPNAICPADLSIRKSFVGYPTSLFVDSEGRIVTYPIVGAAIDQYESTIDKLLAGESVDVKTDTGASVNGDNKYRVYVYDEEGNPVEGVLIQFCDDSTCAFQPTDPEGVATFKVDVEKVYEVHVLQAPEGFRQDEESYKTLETYSDVTIFLEKAE